MPPGAAVEPTLTSLLAERPDFHGWGEVPVNWQAGDALLRWIADHVQPGDRTLETGCGYSTAVLAAVGTAHTVVSPVPQEHDRIRAWCADHAIDCTTVQFVAEPSGRWLPAHMELLAPLDLVLIDGAHGFPMPAIDWYFTAAALSVGGHLVVDDASIPACGQLVDFLSLEAGRWERVAAMDDAVVFRKLHEGVLIDEPWSSQPWNARRPPARSLARIPARLRRLLSG